MSGNLRIRDLKLTSSESDSLKSNKIRQVKDFLLDNYEIRINRFKPSQKEILSKSKKYVFPPSLDDISLHLEENEIHVSDTTLRKLFNSPNQIPNFDPITEYFSGLKWEGVSHIDKFATLIEAKDYKDRVGEGYYQKRQIMIIRKWLVAAVACSLGVHQNEVALGLIQEEEGTGKTTIAHWLCPDFLKLMFVKSDSKKNGFNLGPAFTENFMVLFDEFVGLTKFTSESFKSTMSAQYVDVKQSNDPFPMRKGRIANALFTSNNKTGRDKGFLFPGLGTRRFACLHIENIQYDRIMNDLDVDQIWAEAYTLFKGEFDYKWDRNDFMEFGEYNERFMIETNAVQIIESNFTQPSNETDGQWLTPTDIMVMIKEKRLASRENMKDIIPENIGKAMKQLGYEHKAKRIEGVVRYPYYVKPLF